jgi:glycosyltransferase involved in cell wall biosynthesis
MSSYLGSIVIPAYNEGSVIRRCLDSIFTGLDPQEVEVVVACNGCVDDTVDQAVSAGYPIKVIDLPEPGKIGALRAGERAVSALPRVYLDADVEVTGETLRAVIHATATGAVAARPPVRFASERSTWLVRRYYAARRALPGLMHDLCAGGIFALSSTARERFDEFPDVTSDDLFAARIVAADEIVVVDTDPVVVHVPRNSGSLLHILKRVYRGNEEFAAAHPELARPTTAATKRDLVQLAKNPRHTVDALVFAGFAVTARAALRFGRKPVRWERDESSRV